MSDTTALRVADLPQNSPTAFDLHPDPAALRALALQLGLTGLRKLRFTGSVAAHGKRDWELTARLGATVVQPCVVTLEPVTTRLDVDVRRLYLSEWAEPESPEVEMSDDETVEPLRAEIDIALVMTESLALSLPLYPRKDGADLGEAVFTEPGHEPMRDKDAKPFAGLAKLRDQIDKGD